MAPQFINVTTALRVFSCPTCGVLHGIPEDFIEYKRKQAAEATESDSDNEVGCARCPNGHLTYFAPHNTGPSADELKKQVEELKRELVQRTHELDQLQAKREEGTRPASDASPLAAEPEAVLPPIEKWEYVLRGFRVCPLCKQKFKMWHKAAEHGRDIHHDREFYAATIAESKARNQDYFWEAKAVSR